MSKSFPSFRLKYAKSCAFVLAILLVMIGETSKAAAPVFTSHVVNREVCTTTSPYLVDLTSDLSYSDIPGTQDTFTVYRGPSMVGFFTGSTGSLGLTPTVVSAPGVPTATYTFTSGNIGVRTFTIKVANADGWDTVQINIHLVQLASPSVSGTVTVVHVGDNISLTSLNGPLGSAIYDVPRFGDNFTTAWSPSNANATVTAGVVNGVSVGSSVISYTVTNACGAISATQSVNIITNVAPVITSTSATSLLPGSTLTITGSGFNSVPGRNVVYFGASRATVSAASSTATQLVVTVPVGAIFAPISVVDTTTQMSTFIMPSYTPIFSNVDFTHADFTDAYGPALTFGNFGGLLGKPYSVEYADFDGDGKTDIVICGTGVNGAIVYHNISGGVINGSSFAAPDSFATGSKPVSVKVADIDGDGKLDIITANTGNNSISILRNKSTGVGNISFESNVDVFLPGALPVEVAIGDFNKDGRPDIAVAVNGIRISERNAFFGDITYVPTLDQEKGRLVVVKNNFYRSNGRSMTRFDFDTTTIHLYDTTSAPISVAVGDLNADGKADIVISDHHQRALSVFQNTTSAGSYSFAAPVTQSTAAGSGLLAATDPFNTPGRSYNYSIFRTGYPEQVRIGDLDGDGSPDLAVAVTDSDLLTTNNYNVVALYKNTSSTGGALSFSHASTDTFGTGGVAPVGIALADLSGDGKLDIVNTNSGSADISISIHTAASTMTFNAAVKKSLPAYALGSSAPICVAIGDIDGNNIHDIAVVSRSANKLYVFRGYPRPDTTSIIGDTVLCLGQTTTLHSSHGPTATGSWSSALGHVTFSALSSDTVISVTGFSGGIDTVYYTVVSLTDTNVVRHIIRVRSTSFPGTITTSTGSDSVCVGNNITFSATGAGGTWSSNLPSIATINSSTGVAGGIAASVDTIKYTVVGCGSPSVFPLRVIGTPVAGGITAAHANFCTTTTDSFHISTGTHGGTWSSLHGLVTITTTSITHDSVVVTAGSVGGTDTIQYKVITDCGRDSSRFIITVDTSVVPGVIAGLDSVCVGSNLTLTISSGTTGGTWSGGSVAIATITAGGVVHGVAQGTTTFTYTATTPCGTATTTKTITVSPDFSLGFISGNTRVCIGSTISLSITAPVGTTNTWSSANTTASTVSNTGVVSGVANGTNVITYTATNVCRTLTATYTDTVSATPTASAISGSTPRCAGLDETFTATGTPISGTWSSSNTAVATIDAASGLAHPIVTGTTTISYTVNGCIAVGSAFILTVDTAANPGTITSTTTHPCINTSITLTHTASPVGTPTGTWSLSTYSPAATLTSGGLLTVNAVGVDTVYYTIGTACGSVSAVFYDTVLALPTAGTITGPSTTVTDTVCVGQSKLFVDGTATGTSFGWSSANTAIATVDASGNVYGASGGTTTISYTASNTCGTVSATRPIRVKPLVTHGSIAPVTAFCSGSSVSLVLTGATSGGAWHSSNTAIATVDASGNVGGAATTTVGGATSFTADIWYVVTGDCNSDSTSVTVTVNTAPRLGAITTPITGLDSVCSGTSLTLSVTPTTGGGTWSLSNTKLSLGSTSTIPTTVTAGLVLGYDTVKYKRTNTCGVDSVTKRIKVVGLPDAGTIIAPNTLCFPGSDIQLYDTLANGDTILGSTLYPTYGWNTVSGDAIFLDNFSGQGILDHAGTIVFSFTTHNACGTSVTTHSTTVNLGPDAGTISGPDSVCVASTITLVDAPAFGDYWYSSDTSIATVNASGVVTGVAAGSVTIYYVDTSACGSSQASHNVYVGGLSSVGVIFGRDTACIGDTARLADTLVAGGTWASSNTAIASVDATGLVHANGAGAATISYTTSNGCGPNSATFIFRVFAAPHVTNLTPRTVCDSQLFAFTPSIDSLGASYTWTRDSVTGILNSAGAGSVPVSEYLDNNVDSVVHVTYVFNTTLHGCSSANDLSVAVSPTPRLTSAKFDTVCSKAPFVYLDTESIAGATATWTRAVVPNISNPAGAGTHNINETLTSNILSGVTVTYVYAIGYPGCPTHNEILTVEVDPSPAYPTITTHSPSEVCTRTMDQNFGAASLPPAGVTYTWSATGAQVWASGVGHQYSLVNFTEPGNAVVYLLATISGYNCPVKDSFPVTVGTPVSDMPEVIYFDHYFNCLASDQDTYQWGYDNRSSLDSALFDGETNQSYYEPNPDFTGKYYFVITTHNGCMQKTYFNPPTGVKNVTSSMGEMKIFPNPADQFVNVEIINTAGGKYNVEVVNLLGQKLDTQILTNNKGMLNVSELAAGVYFVNCYRDGVKFASTKFVKN